MKENMNKNLKEAEALGLQLVGSSMNSETSFPTQMAYHELAEIPVKEMDVLEQLEQNIATLELLRSKFNFVMREVRYQLKV